MDTHFVYKNHAHRCPGLLSLFPCFQKHIQVAYSGWLVRLFNLPPSSIPTIKINYFRQLSLVFGHSDIISRRPLAVKVEVERGLRINIKEVLADAEARACFRGSCLWGGVRRGIVEVLVD